MLAAVLDPTRGEVRDEAVDVPAVDDAALFRALPWVDAVIIEDRSLQRLKETIADPAIDEHEGGGRHGSGPHS
ncbi:MAG: hypothetical protein JNL97_15165 [Verrucomicrobiales bacterium]|nr:hypothetical protein [Verrucomicrobiales bacterium]